MPNSLTGQFDPQSGTITFNNQSNSVGGFIFGGSAGGGATAASLALRTLLPQLNLQIQESFVDTSSSTTSTFQFSAAGSNGVVFMHLEVRQGATGNYVAFLGNSNFNEQTLLSSLVTEMNNSATMSQPTQTANTLNLAGVVLEASSSGTNFNGGGSTTSGDESFLITCTTGAYRFSSESRFFLGFDTGGSASTTDREFHEGNFLSHVNFAGNQVLSLFSADQGTFTLAITPGNGGVFLNETFYTQTGTSEQQCI